MLKLSVSALVRYLKNKLDTDDKLQKIYVSGEISNCTKSINGHLYFTLKDEYSAISCIMFKYYLNSLSFMPKTGDKVLIYADTSIYEPGGQLQLNVKKISLDGLGELYARYEALKLKLENEGKFDIDHKIELEKEYIDNVAVLVGDKSAAMSDIKNAFARRWPLCHVDYYPVVVQGSEAPESIINTLVKVDDMNYDAIILARGGGSFEDLFCFNDERLVNTIYDLKTFIVTGIGHEQDYSLADFVADLRAATPTASVELITPDIVDVIDELDTIIESMKDSVQYKYDLLAQNYDRLSDKLFHFQDRLNALSDNIKSNIDRIHKSIIYKISLYSDNLRHFDSDMLIRINTKLKEASLNLKRLTTLLDAYSAENVLKRGYTLVIQDESIVKSKKQLKDKEFDVKFYDGIIKAIERK